MIRFLATFFLLAVGAYVVFDWVFTNHSALFYTDVAVVIVSEIIFLGNFPLLTDKSVLNIKSAVGGVIMNTCAVSLLAWMFIYNLLMRENTGIEVFWIGDVIIIGCLLLKAFVLTSTAEVSLGEQEKLDEIIQYKKDFKLSIMEYSEDVLELLKNNSSISDKDSLIRQFRIAIDKIDALPSGALQSEAFVQEIRTILGEICSLCSDSEFSEESLSNLRTLINKIVLITKKLK